MILDKIVAATEIRIAKEKQEQSFEAVKAEALALPAVQDFPFEKALREQDFNFICEVKKASPSKGIIAEHFPYLDIAKEYERSGAVAISVLTEPDFFKGSPQYLQEIAAVVNIPVLRKDFIIDEYQIYQAKIWGAKAILLICAILDVPTLTKYRELADSLGLSCLVEAHDKEEVQKAIQCGARIIGVNNRNLKDFTVDVQNSVRLRQLVEGDVIFVSESGLETPEDIQVLRDNNIGVALMGETFMRSEDKVAMLKYLYGPMTVAIQADANHAVHGGVTKAAHSEAPSVNGNTPSVASLVKQPYVPQIKICGNSDISTVATLAEEQPDYIGLIFAPSKRQVTVEEAKEFVEAFKIAQQDYLAHGSKRLADTGDIDFDIIEPKFVGVFVNESLENIVHAVAAVGLDAVQLHGDETEEFILMLKALLVETKLTAQVWKAVAIQSRLDANKWLHSSADNLVFDAYSKDARGGTGETFDWQALKGYPRSFTLAGGLSEKNVARAIRTVRPAMIDLNSGVETDGRKDITKIETVMSLVRKVTQ